MRKYHIQPGDKFNRLTCIGLSHIGKHNRTYFLFKCDCGNEKIILGSLVKSGNTKSCGCLSKEVKKSKIYPDNIGVTRQIILGYKRRAENRGFEWELTEEDVINIISKPCFYCGISASNMKITKNCKSGFAYNGIDRMDPKYGYFPGNCVPCCSQCNRAKMALKRDDFMMWIKRVYEHNYSD